jgi:hypothetical protein
MVQHKGAGEELVEGPTRTGQSRVLDLDAGRWARSALADGVPVKVVSERLGHASATITLTV